MCLLSILIYSLVKCLLLSSADFLGQLQADSKIEWKVQISPTHSLPSLPYQQTPPPQSCVCGVINEPI